MHGAISGRKEATNRSLPSAIEAGKCDNYDHPVPGHKGEKKGTNDGELLRL